MKHKLWNLFMKIMGVPFWCTAILGLFLLSASLLGIRSYAVLSGSMEPAISTGSVVLVNTDRRDPVVGDVITYRLGKNLVTHRVSRVLDDAYETRGDANDLPDGETVTSEQIIGCVSTAIPYLGYVIFFLRSKKGMLLMGAFLLLYLFTVCTSELFKIREESRA